MEKMGLDARIGHIILPYSCRDMGVIVVYKRSRSWRGRASAGRKEMRQQLKEQAEKNARMVEGAFGNGSFGFRASSYNNQ